jgi:hypothetical protein
MAAAAQRRNADGTFVPRDEIHHTLGDNSSEENMGVTSAVPRLRSYLKPPSAKTTLD